MTAPLLAVAREVRGPTLIEPKGRLRSMPTLDACVDRIRELAAGRPVAFRLSQIAHPDVDPFLGVSVRVTEGGDRGFVIAVIGDRWHDERDAGYALKVVEAAFAKVAAA